jgi:hypothetical protein
MSAFVDLYAALWSAAFGPERYAEPASQPGYDAGKLNELHKAPTVRLDITRDKPSTASSPGSPWIHTVTPDPDGQHRALAPEHHKAISDFIGASKAKLMEAINTNHQQNWKTYKQFLDLPSTQNILSFDPKMGHREGKLHPLIKQGAPGSSVEIRPTSQPGFSEVHVPPEFHNILQHRAIIKHLEDRLPSMQKNNLINNNDMDALVRLNALHKPPQSPQP